MRNDLIDVIQNTIIKTPSQIQREEIEKVTKNSKIKNVEKPISEHNNTGSNDNTTLKNIQ